MENSVENAEQAEESVASSQEKSPSIVQQTIETMETAQLCIHPVHYHSFTPVNFMLSMRKCAACDGRLNPIFGGGGDVQVVKCLACGVFAHRSCAMQSGTDWEAKQCSVNALKIREKESENLLKEDESFLHVFEENGKGTSSSCDSTTAHQASASEPAKDCNEEKDAQPTESTEPMNPLARLLSVSGSFLSRGGGTQGNVETETASESDVVEVSASQAAADEGTEDPVSTSTDQCNDLPSSDAQATVSDSPTLLSPISNAVEFDEDGDECLVWTPEGPPRHWADNKSVNSIIRPNLTVAENVVPIVEDNNWADDNGDDDETAPLHIAHDKFASVSRALQENVIAHFIRRPVIEQSLSEGQSDTGVSSIGAPSEIASETGIRRTATVDSETDSKVDMNALLAEAEPKSPEKPKPAIVRMASGTYESAKTVTSAQKKLGVACIVGGVAGGVAGLVLAGPAGAVIGAKAGQTAGLLGVVLEGSMTVGVIVAGVAAGGFTGHAIQQNQEKRVLTIGEDGVKRKVLLVRPNIWIDPIWEKICADVRETTPSPPRRTFGIIPSSEEREADIAKKERYRQDSDIVQADETEIPTKDKVLLLVSRSLNDKRSLPGHVYKSLVQKYRDRCEEREADATEAEDDGPLEIEMDDLGDTGQREVNTSDNGVENEAVANNGSAEESAQSQTHKEHEKNDDGPPRVRRQDTHAVIKHVTATLLEVRPGFASSPIITEMSATAVECLVFGELYDSVFEEIVEETREADEALVRKIAAFEKAHASSSSKPFQGVNISEPALDALRRLPQSHSAVDKLRDCVYFLELISGYFASQGSALCADSLLKIVCQHIIAAKVPNINAEIAFLEEFARDEQLLRGKEGYSLVTLQASLHFLNASADFDVDIFEPHEEDTEYEDDKSKEYEVVE
jgi:hypothetical protein